MTVKLHRIYDNNRQFVGHTVALDSNLHGAIVRSTNTGLYRLYTFDNALDATLWILNQKSFTGMRVADWSYRLSRLRCYMSIGANHAKYQRTINNI